MELEFSITNQVITRTDTEQAVINESANYMDATFTFTTNEWTGVHKYALFKNSKGKAYCIDLGTTCTNTVKIPYEVLTADYFIVTIFGLGDGYRITTTEIPVHMVRSGFTDKISAPEPYDGDIFSQLKELIDNCLCDVKIQGNQLLFYKQDTVYFRLTVNNHTHTPEQVNNLDDTIGLEIKRAYTILTNMIRTYGE